MIQLSLLTALRQREKPNSAKNLILRLVNATKVRYAAHELKPAYLGHYGVILPYSENCLATRLNDLEREGKLTSNYRENENFKEWGLVGV